MSQTVLTTYYLVIAWSHLYCSCKDNRRVTWLWALTRDQENNQGLEKWWWGNKLASCNHYQCSITHQFRQLHCKLLIAIILASGHTGGRTKKTPNHHPPLLEPHPSRKYLTKDLFAVCLFHDSRDGKCKINSVSRCQKFNSSVDYSTCIPRTLIHPKIQPV